MSGSERKRLRVAVLGGGCGAMAAAFELTRTREQRERYEVVVYQQGWRLGGKGASGRNAAHEERIEEHGLHMLMGFYENAFRIVREAYAERHPRPDDPFRTWKDAFTPQRMVSFGGQGGDVWNIHFPKLPGEPGDPSLVMRIEEALAEFVRWLEGLILGHPDAASLGQAAPESTVKMALAREIAERLHREPHEAGTVAGLLRDARDRVVDAFLAKHPGLEHLLILLDLGAAVVSGIVRDVIPGGGWHAIDDLDLREWMIDNGASEKSANSAPIRALYDLVFAYEGGDVTRPRVEAGTMMKTVLRMVLTYKDAPLWKMNAGMGDTLFTPLYEVLVQRGVRFEFFHRVESLGVRDGDVATIRFNRQVWTKDPTYHPLVTVKGLGCWPSAPRWEQIHDGERLRREGVDLESAWCHQSVERYSLEKGLHYDIVVLGVSIGAFRTMCRELIDANAGWAAMVERIKTVQTQSVQLWTGPTTEGLGWTYGTTVLAGYVPAIGSWGDMSHLIPREEWPPGSEPGGCQYLCGVLPEAPGHDEPDFPAKMKERVRVGAIRWIDDELAGLWPDAGSLGAFDWDVLADPQHREGHARFDAQYWRANVDPSERYVLTVPGSSRYRIEPGDSGFPDLYLCGDWTRTSINGGSAEAAFESGVACAKAIVAAHGPRVAELAPV